MDKNLLVLTTHSGNGKNSFSAKITREARKLGFNTYRYFCNSIDAAFEKHPEWNAENLIIHCRAAHPNSEWMHKLADKESDEFHVVNITPSLSLTSDKWEAIKLLGDEGNIPTSLLIDKRTFNNDVYVQILNAFPEDRYVVVKPRVSAGQGKFVYKVSREQLDNREVFIDILNQIPLRHIIVQRYILFSALVRAVVIGGFTLPLGTYDTPKLQDWKCSVCLNPKQRVYHLDNEERVFAAKMQMLAEGDINFIDFFKGRDGTLTLSEINTACNLNIHEKVTGTPYSRKIAEYLADIDL